MNEVIEAEAEVMGGSEELSVAYVPATISANFDTLEARVRELVSDYEGARYDLTDAGAIRDAKRHRTYLNGVFREIDERRKAVKREYMRPYEEFDNRAREVAQIAKAASDGIKEQLDEAEKNRKAAKLAALKEHYEEYAGLLAPVVPYERLHDPKWLNKGCAMPKAEAELDEKVEKLASDWEGLKEAFGGTDYYDVAERELFATLDLGSAIAAATSAKAQAERIAALREAMEGAAEPEPEPEPTPYEAKVAENEARVKEYFESLAAEAEPVSVPEPAEPEPYRDYVIEVRCTSTQAHAIAAQLKALGLTGRIHTR